MPSVTEALAPGAGRELLAVAKDDLAQIAPRQAVDVDHARADVFGQAGGIGGEFEADFLDDPQDVPLGRVAHRPQDEVGRGEGVEVGDMGVHHVGAVKKLP